MYKTREENKLVKRNHLIDLKIERANLKLAIFKHESNVLVKKYHAYQLEKLTHKFDLKRRALKQKEKRAQAASSNTYSFPSLLKKLDVNFENAKSKLEMKYFQATPILFQDTWETYLGKTVKRLETRKTKLAKVSAKKMSKKLTQIEATIKSSMRRIDSIALRIQKLSRTNPYEQMLESDTLLKLDGLSMYFGGLKAVDNLSFEVKQGSIFGLIGPNGAGKTTVFNCITRFYKATYGKVYYRNQSNEVICLNDYVVHNVIKEGIVRTFQNVELIWELNVIDNLLVAAHTMYRSSFFGHLFNSKVLRQEELILREKAIKILIDLGLQDYMYMYPLGLPYGILKKVELARTLMANPKLIILDEPAAGLNDAETENLAHTIKKIRDQYHTTIFLVEHDMGLVMDICDTICAISFGKKLAIGSPKDIQNSSVVRDAYLGGE
ncbi:MAG: ATP-binding cassette domain-containing protein [Candidatus Izemoplasmatales bacterium]